MKTSLSLTLVALVVVAAACTPTTASVRKDNNYGERQGREAERALDAAELQLDALEVEAARKQIIIAARDLKDPEIGFYPEHEALQARLEKVRVRLIMARETRVKLAREAVVARQQEQAIDAMDQLDRALEPLRQRGLTQADLEHAKEAFHHVHDVLGQGRKLESLNTVYARFAQDTEAMLAKKRSDIVLAEGVLAFLRGPVAQRDAAQKLLKDVSTSTTTARPHLYREALAKLVACKMSAKEMLTTVERLDRAPIAVENEATTPAAVSRYCEAHAITVAKRIPEAAKDAQKAQARRIPPPVKTTGQK